MATGSPEKQTIEADVNTFINGLVADTHQEVYFRGWCDLVTTDEKDKKPKPKIMVVTNFRVVTIKTGTFGPTVGRTYYIRDLTGMKNSKDIGDKLHLHLDFAEGGEVDIMTNTLQDMITIAHSVRFNYEATQFGKPIAEEAKINLLPQISKDYMPPEPDAQDGLLACYLSECDYVGISQRIHVLDHFMTCFQLRDRTLDFDDCLAFMDKSKEATKDITAIANTLRNSEWFTEITALGGVKFQPEGVAALAPLFTASSRLTRLTLSNVKGGKAGFTAVGKALATGKHSLIYMNISRNKLGDDGVKDLVDGLLEGKKVLHTLSVRDCQLTGKGITELKRLISAPAWLAGLKVLDVSENNLGKAGSEAIKSWLANDAITIEQFHVTNADADLGMLLNAIMNNKKLVEKELKTLNISGNKVPGPVAALVSTMISSTSSISQIFLSNCHLDKKSFIGILQSVFTNDKGVQFALDFSGNDLGKSAVKEMAEQYPKWQKNANKNPGMLHTLNLADTNLGVEGLVIACKAVTGSSIVSLSLDANVKVGLFGIGKEAGDALASLLSGTPSLKELSVAGDDKGSALKTAINTMFPALKANKTLTALDVSKNKFGDAGMKFLAEGVAGNDSLQRLYLDDNGLTVKGIREMHRGITANKSLHDWQLPINDIVKVFKAAKSDKKMNEVRVIVAECENIMDRNDEAAQARQQAEEKKGGAPSKFKPLPTFPFNAMRGLRLCMPNQDPYGSGIRAQVRAASLLLDQLAQRKETKAAEKPAVVAENTTENKIEEEEEEDEGDEGDEGDDDANAASGAASPRAGATAGPSALPSTITPAATATANTLASPRGSATSVSGGTQATVSAPKVGEAPKAGGTAVPATSSATPAKKNTLEEPKKTIPSSGSSGAAQGSQGTSSGFKLPAVNTSNSGSSAPGTPASPRGSLGGGSSLVKPPEAKGPATLSVSGPPSGTVTPGSPSPSNASVKYDDWKLKNYSYEELKMTSKLPAGVDPNNRELYLTEPEFKKLFAMDKATWNTLPPWKRQKEKQLKLLGTV